MANVTRKLLPATHELSAKTIRVRDVLDQSRKMFAARWLPYCGTSALGYVALVATTEIGGREEKLIPEWGETTFDAALIIASATYLFCWLLAQVAIPFAVAQNIRGSSFTFRRSALIVLTRSPVVLALKLLITSYSLLAMVPLIVPGLIAFCAYAVAIPACMIEGLGPLDSMFRSAFLTKGNRWPVFGILCVIYPGAMGGEKLVDFAAIRLVDFNAYLPISLTFDVVVDAFCAVAVGVLYVRLRTVREGADIEHVAKVFD